MDEYINANCNVIFNELNFRITDAEIYAAIAKLKNGKASGFDGILNEMIKAGKHALVPALNKIFNFILLSGTFPDKWRITSSPQCIKKVMLINQRTTEVFL